MRRSAQHSPEGTLAIEVSGAGPDEANGASAARPVSTLSALRPPAAVAAGGGGGGGGRMGFNVSAATRVEFEGERWLHAWQRHAFGGSSGGGSGGVALVARARQFSSFVVLVGRLADGRTLDPAHAFLVKNRDEVRLGYLLLFLLFLFLLLLLRSVSLSLFR